MLGANAGRKRLKDVPIGAGIPMARSSARLHLSYTAALHHLTGRQALPIVEHGSAQFCQRCPYVAQSIQPIFCPLPLRRSRGIGPLRLQIAV